MRASLLCLSLLASVSVSFGGITPITNLDFTAPNIAQFSTTGGPFNGGLPYAESGATFTTSTGNVYTFSGILDLDFANSGAGDLRVSFNQPYNLFGFTTNGSTAIPNGRLFGLTGVDFFSNANFTGAIGSDANAVAFTSSPAFYGLQNTSAFQSIVIHFSAATGSGFSPYLDDFKFEGQAAGSPEPASLLLLGAGIAALGLLAQRKRS